MLWADHVLAVEWLPELLQTKAPGLGAEQACSLLRAAEVSPALTTGELRRQSGEERMPLASRLATELAPHLRTGDDGSDSDEAVAPLEVARSLLSGIRKALSTPLEPASKAAKLEGGPSKELPLPPPAKLGQRSAEPSLFLDAWYRDQPAAVARFVVGVERRNESSHPDVTCRCGQACRSSNFRIHLSRCHFSEIVESGAQAELEVGALTLRAAEPLIERAEQQLKAEHEVTRLEMAKLKAQLAAMEADLSRSNNAARYFSAHGTRSNLAMKELGGGRRLCQTAELHQRLWEEGYFKEPLNQTVDELHYLTLKRIELGEDAKKGGAGTHLTPTARALSTRMYNKSSSSGYRAFRAVYRYPLAPDVIRKGVARPFKRKLKGGPFAAFGCHQLEWGQQAFDLYEAGGFDPRTKPFGLCWDPAKMKQEIKWDQKTNSFVGSIDFDTNLKFDSWKDMEDFLANKVAAGYINTFLLCPLDPQFPSAFVPVGIVTTDLKYTTADLKRLIKQIIRGLTAAGFGHVLPTMAADNPSVHSKLFLLSGNPRAVADEREPGGSVADDLLNGNEPILTLGAHRLKGSSCETVVTVDPTHTMKNGSLQPLHLSRLLMIGCYVMLTMMFVLVRVEAGLYASDVTGADPMDVGSAERRMNVATRRELAKHPECFGMLVYLWAIASGRAAWLDRGLTTTPRMRIGWAFDSLIVMRWWLDWIEVTQVGSLAFISMQTHAAHVIMAQMLIMVAVMWSQRFPDDPFAPWLIGSDQNEHLYNEIRSFRLNQPDFTADAFISLIKQLIHERMLGANGQVHLPAVYSKRGFNRAMYTPSKTGEYIWKAEDWAKCTLDEVRTEYAAGIERVRPLFVALGCAQALKDAGRWHAPSLEEWASIEKAIDKTVAEVEKEVAMQRRQHVVDGDDGDDDQAGNNDEAAHDEASDDGDGKGVEGVSAGYEAGEEGEEVVYYPEKIVKHRYNPKKKRRELLIKWKDYDDSEDSLSWESQQELVDGGNVVLVYKYLMGVPHFAKALPSGLKEAAEAEMVEQEMEMPSTEGESKSEVRRDMPQPEITPVTDVSPLLEMLSTALGSETPNGTRCKPLSAEATEKQREAYEATHITNPETLQTVHKAAALSHVQKLLRDATPGAGRNRYVTGERQPIISEDKDGTGLACWDAQCHPMYYEVHIASGTPLNSRSEIVVEGSLHVAYARVLELRKLNGKKLVVRLSVRKADASRCSAVVIPLVQNGNGQWVEDFSTSPPLLVPVLSLGQRVVATEGTGALSGSYSFAAASPAAGGSALRTMYLSSEMFEAGEVTGLQTDLMEMKLAELKEELESRGEPKTGNKPWLRRRLHAALVREYLSRMEEDDL